MEKELFQEKITELCEAFRADIPKKETLKIYWKYLNHIEDDFFKNICMQIIMKERFFPAISVFNSFYKELNGKNYTSFERVYVC